MRLNSLPACIVALALIGTCGCAASKAASTAAPSPAASTADGVYPGAVPGIPPGTKPGTDKTYWTHDSYDKVKAWYDKQPFAMRTIVRIDDKTWISIHPDL